LAGETEVLGENLPQCRFVHDKPHMMPVRESGPPRWEASVYPLSYGTAMMMITQLFFSNYVLLRADSTVAGASYTAGTIRHDESNRIQYTYRSDTYN
jgi:hypothetical protein